MEYLRTDDHCFKDIPDFNYSPHYVDVDDTEGGKLRMHYIDEGAKDAEIVLCLHGEPTWSFLYRHVIRELVASNYRVIAPDLVGFGRLDKPTQRDNYSYARHVEWTGSLLEQIGLTGLTLVCQDWGGLIGLRLLAEKPHLFKRAVVANTSLPTGFDEIPAAFYEWKKLSQELKVLPIGKLVGQYCTTELSPATIAAYDAPFPDESYKVCARYFPMLVPTSKDDPAHEANCAAWKVLEQLEIPFLTSFSDSDPITKNGEKTFQRRIPGAKQQPHTLIKGASHFLQEDAGVELARVVTNFMKASA